MAFIDYYKILGVDRNIPQKDVRAAYRKRAKLFHPDLHPNDPKAKAKFQALNEAYDVISDPEKRAKYDKYGEQWRQADAFQGNDTEGLAAVILSKASTSVAMEVEVEVSPVSSKICLEVVVFARLALVPSNSRAVDRWKQRSALICTQLCWAEKCLYSSVMDRR